MRAKFIQRLVYQKSWIVGGDFEQYTARLAAAEGIKIISIDFRRDVKARVDNLLAHSHKHVFIFYPKGDMVDSSRRVYTTVAVYFDDVDDVGILDSGCCIAMPIAIHARVFVAE